VGRTLLSAAVDWDVGDRRSFEEGGRNGGCRAIVSRVPLNALIFLTSHPALKRRATFERHSRTLEPGDRGEWRL